MDVQRIGMGAALVALVCTPGFVLARGGNWRPPLVGIGPDRGAKMQRHDMTQACQTHCQATTTAIDQLTATLQEARESNDPARMQTALDQAQQPLAEMKHHIGECQSMMSMMQQMHGGMGSPMKGKQ